jgi:ankyrin repeat protein
MHRSEKLLASGADINATTSAGKTVLSYVVTTNSVDTAQTLLNHGANIENREKDGITPLISAVLFNAMEMASFLLNHGANVEASTDSGNRPLHLAAERDFGQMTHLLIEKGADIECKTNPRDEDRPHTPEGLTPLLVAATYGSIETFYILVDHGANAKATAAGFTGVYAATVGLNKPLIRFFAQQGVSINARSMEEGNTALIRAVRDGYPQIVSLLIKLGADVNASNGIGWTPLHFAAESGFEDVVEILLKSGANPTTESLDGKRPRTISWEKRYKNVTKMLDGSVPITLDARNQSKARSLSLLFYAARNGHLNNISQILDEGVDVNSLDADGRSSLSLAAEHGWSDVVHALTSRNADPNLQDNYGGSPLSWASRYGHSTIVEHLLDRGANSDSPDMDGQSPLSAVSQHGHVQTAMILLKHGANPNSSTSYGKTPLLFAVGNGQVDTVQLLLESGADINYKSPQGDSALSLAAANEYKNILDALQAHPNLIKSESENGDSTEDATSLSMISVESSSALCLKRHSMLIDASRKGQIVMIKRLIKAGADPNASFNLSEPLYEAASQGQSGAVATLVEHGARIEGLDHGFSPPLVIAASCGHTSTVELLCSLGANLEGGNGRGHTALMEAALGGHDATASLLLQRGAKTEIKGRRGRGPLWHATNNRDMKMVELLVDNGANLEAADHHGCTPLTVAVEKGDRKLTKFLLEKGAQMGPESDDNYSPLCYAASNGDEAIVDLLLDHGADVDYLSDGNRTALHIATSRGNLMVMKMLIEAGANVDLKDADGRTALSLAKESSNDRTMRLLYRARSLRKDSHRERRKADEMDFNKKDSYHYQPLMMQDSIRIIELYPGNPGDIIDFELDEVSLVSKTPFEALSYEWQEKFGTIPVQCEGQKILITPNCKAAMEKLRLRDKSRYLWIDAICINQTDDQERNQQVAIMGDIYRAADKVIMWLGEETETIHETFDLLPTVARAQRILLQAAGKLTAEEGSRDGGEDPQKLLDNMFKDRHIMRDFEDLMERTYWTRAWILPEIVIAGSRGVAMCGNQSCDWTTFKAGMPLYEFCKFGQLPMVFESVLVGDFAAGAEVRFEDVVFVLQTLDATDPRDKVFASLGIASEGRVPIGREPLVERPVADYTMSVQQVFTHAARYIIDIAGIFWVWRLGIQRSTKRIDNLPSWVPDFNRRPPNTEIDPFGDSRQFYLLDIPEDPITTETSLQIGGCIVDKIAFKLTLTRDLEISTILALVVDSLAKRNRSIYSKYPAEEGLDANRTTGNPAEEKESGNSLMRSTNASALFTTIASFKNAPNSEGNGTTADDILPLFTGYLIWTLLTNTSTPELSKTAPDYAERFAKPWAKEVTDEEAFVDFELDNLKLMEDGLRYDRDLVYTENGYFGLANPGEAEVGQVVALIGSDMRLHLMRRKEDSTPYYEYVDVVFLNLMGKNIDRQKKVLQAATSERLEIR